jgi:cell wall-associated NlpC family hydrolase
VKKDELQPGDLVFFNTLKSAFSHVGIYIGDNKFIHAPSSGKTVRVESMQTGYWASRYNGAQRLENEANANEANAKELTSTH